MLRLCRQYLRYAFSVYFVLYAAVLTSCLMIMQALISFPFGVRRMQRFLGWTINAWINGLCAWIYYVAPSDFVVTVDAEGLSQSRITDTLSQIAIAFGIGSGRVNLDEPENQHYELLIANHQIYSDWIYLWAFLNHLGRSGNMKIVLKRSIQFVPFLGLAMKLAGFVFLHRSWSRDSLNFGRRIRRIGAHGLPYNLLIFPEGTTMTEGARVKSQVFGKERGHPVLQHVLLPRSTGMYHALRALSEASEENKCVEGVLDLTVGYTGLTPKLIPETFYTLRSLFRDAHAPPQIHVNAAYIPLADIPLGSQEEFTAWLIERYQRKNMLLEQFYAEGRFQGIESRPMPLTRPASYKYFWAFLFGFHLPIILLLIIIAKKSRRREEDSDDGEENIEEALSKHTSQRNIPKGQSLGLHPETPSPRANATFTANPAADQLILFGGEHFDGKHCTFYNDLFVYAIGEAKWYKVVTALGPGPRSAHQAVWGPDGRLYVFGGEFGTSKETRFLHYRDFWALDTKTWSWEALPSHGLPPARSGHRMAVWGTEWAVLFGGFIDTNGTAVYLEDLWLYHFARRAWCRVDWLNPELPHPTARSAFQLSACAEGVLLYGGYCQVKGRNGVPKGQVLNDLWLLKLPSEPNGNLQLELRWDRRKTASTAPLPRSGCASTRFGPDHLAVFGGVFDEDVSDEFIQGTCSNELHLYTFKTNKWSKVEYGLDDPAAAHGHHLLCPRFNAMMTTARDGTVFLYGGIWEIGDVQYTLDDLYRLENVDGGNSLIFKVLTTISVDLSNWQEQIEAERREMMASDSSDDDSDEDSEDDEDDEESDDDEVYSSQAFSSEEGGCPPINRKLHRTLKDYFDASTQYWLERARQDNPLATEKDQRKAAFMLAKAKWDEMSLVESVERL